MHIKKVELENIKSHADSTFEFSPGSTAITGENGAGKTTILEAIAWTLFDVLDYKKDDFVRRGAKKGAARVTFESGLDEREYTVFRDTGTGYNVFDPQLNLRIADKKEEVTRFLWQHLGVEPGTDLDSLFKHAIGVPQGTFTAIFLATAAERKKTFDTLLKVEEYRRGAEELLKTQRFVENQITAARETIARAEGQIGEIEAVESGHKTFSAEAETFSAEVAQIQTEIAERGAALKLLDDAEAAVSKLRTEFDAAGNAKTQAAAEFERRKAELEQARTATAKIAEVRPDAERHSSILSRIHELERERVERDRLRSELQKVETAEAAVKAEEKHTRQQLASVEHAHKEIARLRPLAEQQAEIERTIDGLRTKLAEIRAAANQVAGLNEKLDKLRQTFTDNRSALTDAIARAKDAETIPTLEKREGEIVAEAARLRASLERDEKFQNEIRNGLCPILSEKCLNLKEGQTLEGFLSSQFDELRTKLSGLDAERKTVAVALRTSRDAEKFSARIPALEERGSEIEAEGKRLRAELEALNKDGSDGKAFDEQLAAAEKRLADLDNPKAKITVYEREAAREISVREAITNVERNLERLETDRRIVVEELDSYKDLDESWKEATAIRDATIEAHRAFLAFEATAATEPEKAAAFELAGTELESAESSYESARIAFESADKNYDRERHLTEKEALSTLRLRLAESGVRMENARRRAAELAAELERLNKIRSSLRDEYREKERLDKVLEATVFIRDTLKDAAPLVARNYVFHVSAEANQLFREISGNAERTLKWAEDYGIVMEEGGHDRPFQSLSGGEQMAAALSVRLALLKQLSDIRIAFFDEPTTNMDAERRENLAMQIGQIKHFDQLFVISHDDTFEGYMDHEIRVEK